MTQKDKELLIKDLCARLPYKVKLNANYFDFNRDGKLFSINNNKELILSPERGYPFDVAIEKCKPYLFPISSMTEEATREFNATLEWITTADGYSESVMTYDSFDCLNKHHIDYRGLIPKGLAIDATGLNIY